MLQAHQIAAAAEQPQLDGFTQQAPRLAWHRQGGERQAVEFAIGGDEQLAHPGQLLPQRPQQPLAEGLQRFVHIQALSFAELQRPGHQGIERRRLAQINRPDGTIGLEQQCQVALRSPLLPRRFPGVVRAVALELDQRPSSRQQPGDLGGLHQLGPDLGQQPIQLLLQPLLLLQQPFALGDGEAGAGQLGGDGLQLFQQRPLRPTAGQQRLAALDVEQQTMTVQAGEQGQLGAGGALPGHRKGDLPAIAKHFHQRLAAALRQQRQLALQVAHLSTHHLLQQGRSRSRIAPLDLQTGQVRGAPGQPLQVGRVGLRQLAIQPQRFLRGRQRLLAAAHTAVPDAQVVEDHGQIAQVGGVGLRQLAIQPHRFFCGRQRLLAAAQIAVVRAQVVEGVCQIAQVGRVGLRQLAADPHRFFCGRQRLLAAADSAEERPQPEQCKSTEPLSGLRPTLHPLHHLQLQPQRLRRLALLVGLHSCISPPLHLRRDLGGWFDYRWRTLRVPALRQRHHWRSAQIQRQQRCQQKQPVSHHAFTLRI